MAALALCAVSVALIGSVANAAYVKVDGLLLRADGGFTPRELPRNSFAPIRFQGWASIESTRGGLPPALEHAEVYFDRDGRVLTQGLAVCDPVQLQGATTPEARNRCGDAIVGTGFVGGAVPYPSGTVRLRVPLTLFNGPRQNGDITVVIHAQAPFPVAETYVVTAPLERLRGGFSYRASIDVPPIAGGIGVLLSANLDIGRSFRFQGRERSYTLARCSDGILETRGHFLFANETIIDGAVFKPCRVLP